MTDDVKELQEYVTRLERAERARMNHSSLERLEDVGAELVMMGLAVTEMQGVGLLYQSNQLRSLISNRPTLDLG